MSFGFPRRRRATAPALPGTAAPKRKPRIVIPPCPASRLEVLDDTARFTIARELFSPNKTLWASSYFKKDDRDSWGVAIFNAIVIYLEANGQALSVIDRQVIANRAVPIDVGGKRVVRRRHRAPQQRYEVRIIREVPKKANFIRDDDNLTFAVKSLLDALKAHCVIYEDSREWLTRPLPIQRVSEDGQYRTIVDVTPWAQPRLSGATHAAGQ
jgi:hypothetical protein